MKARSCYVALQRINYWLRSCLISPQHSCLVSVSRPFSQWDIVSAVCLERKPVITQPLISLEQKYFQYIQRLEIEKSLLSDHEIRHIEDKRITDKLKAGELEDMEAISKQTAQDAEDAWLEEFNQFKPHPRITEADVNDDRQSTQRKLDSTLALVIKQKLGNDYRWILPQAVHQNGETLRQTAERVLADLCCSYPKVQLMGNAPVGYYKYKYPKVVRGNGICGAKVFFFKAQVLPSKQNLSITLKHTETVSSYLWLTHNELKDVLQPVYCKVVQSFLLPDTFIVEDQTSSPCYASEDDEHFKSSALSQA